MITGHLGVAALLRRASRRPWSDVAFAALLAASLAPDFLDVALAAARICNPWGLYSHTLPAIAIQGAVYGGAALLVTGRRDFTFAIVAVVLLHMPADFFTGQKLFLPGGDLHGLLWYETPIYDFVAELALVGGGWWILRRQVRAPRWAITRIALTLLVVVQTGFDLYASLHRRGIKPNACPVEAPALDALWSAPAANDMLAAHGDHALDVRATLGTRASPPLPAGAS